LPVPALTWLVLAWKVQPQKEYEAKRSPPRSTKAGPATA